MLQILHEILHVSNLILLKRNYQTGERSILNWFSKSKRWIVAHKNWLAFLAMFVISYFLGKKANKNYLEMANLAKEQYKKDNAALVREQQLKEMRELIS